MRVTRLDGQVLDFWVAKSEGRQLLPTPPEADEFDPAVGLSWHPDVFQPSSNWAHGGPIVSNDWYDIETILIDWFGPGWPYVKAIMENPLKWFLRAYVASKFGDEVEEINVPDFEAERTDGSVAARYFPMLRSTGKTDQK